MSDYIFPPAALRMQDHLRLVQPERVVIVRPSEIPNRMIQIQQVPGTSGAFTDRPMLTFICWGRSLADAMEFTEEVRFYVRQCEALGDHTVYKIRGVSGPVPRPDPDTGRQRCQFTDEIQVRGKFMTPSP